MTVVAWKCALLSFSNDVSHWPLMMVTIEGRVGDGGTPDSGIWVVLTSIA